MSSKREVSNLSYTNKDFNSIYTELLEYAKKLSYRWDPAASDESDPGVVLLKLAALIGDKNNYNIDKNVLELMPVSVTQLGCARQLFEQCGYTMRYYNSAEGYVKVTLNNHPEEVPEEYKDVTYTYKVPRFTMFSDIENTSVYTSTEECFLVYQTGGRNKSAGVDVPVLEGTAVEYTINNDSLITISNLDSNNRLYFTETDIAENGIFITNVDSSKNNYSNYDEWYRVECIETEEKGSRCYKFGVSLDGSLCYIQFPDDAELLFGEGLNITYIRTKGVRGNIIPGAVRQFYVDTKFVRTGGPEDPTEVAVAAGEASDAVITINNDLPITNGKDPEGIDEAYRSYKRVKQTFNTLVSIKDYTDYMMTSESASNGYVCDRVNDIQHSHKIKEPTNSGNVLNTIIESSIVEKTDIANRPYYIEEPSMEAFDLCIYALQYVPAVDSEATYKSSFTLTDGSTYINKLKNSTIKSLQHDFVSFDDNKILMIKNKYPIVCTVIPRYQLTETEIFQIKSNIETALYKTLNSKELTFGEGITFDLLESTILDADDRIKHVEGLTTPKYTTWVVYKSKDKFKEIRVDNDSLSGGYQVAAIKSATDYLKLKEETTLYYYDTPNKSVVTVDKDTHKFNKNLTYYTFDETLHELWNTFRAEIYAKNILAGVSPLYDKATEFSYGVNQLSPVEYPDVARVTTNTVIELHQDESSSELELNWKTEPLKENEAILLTAPNYIQESNYSSYVKVIYSLSNATTDNNLNANGKYQLKENDFIIFFWKAADADTYYTYMKYSANTAANMISPTFVLPKIQPNKTEEEIKIFSTLSDGKGYTDGTINIPALGDKSVTAYVKNLTSSKYFEVLEGSNIINTLKKNTIHINNEDNGSTNICWILNTVTDADGKDVYRLFQRGEYEYTLRSGEYFFYTNKSKTTLYLLGEGTVITRSPSWDNFDDVWDTPVLTYTDIIANGISYLDNYWKTIILSSKYTVSATEMQQHLIGPGNDINLVVKDSSKIVNDDHITKTDDGNIVGITFDNQKFSLNGFNINYIDDNNNRVDIDVIDSDETWQVQSILNINMSATEPQKLYPHQTIELFHIDDVESFETINKDNPKTLFVLAALTTEVFGMTNKINLVGGKFVDLSPYNDSTYDLMTYEAVANTDNSPEVIYHEDKFESTISLPNPSNNEAGEEVPTEFVINLEKFSLLQGTYLLHITADEDITKLKVTQNDSNSNEQDNFTLTSLLDDTNVDLMYVYKLVVEDTSDIYLTITATTAKKNAKLHIHPLFRFTNKNLTDISVLPSTDVTFEDILLDKLSLLDAERRFDYTYIPEHGISNPLTSVSFLMQDHFYNKFTICEWTPNKSYAEDLIVNSGIR